MRRLLPFALGVFCAMTCTECEQGRRPPRSVNSSSPSPSAVNPSTTRWYPIAGGGVPLPGNWTATCELDCDVWSGRLRPPDLAGPLSMYGGMTGMAGMYLNQRGAAFLGQEMLPGTLSSSGVQRPRAASAACSFAEIRIGSFAATTMRRCGPRYWRPFGNFP